MKKTNSLNTLPVKNVSPNSWLNEEDWERKTLVASVIGRDATQWSKVVFINKGTQDGVTDHLALITDAGVIGQVIHAGTKYLESAFDC